MPVLLFVGSVGLWDRAHQLSPDIGLLLGIALALYGFSLALRRPIGGGVMLGLGVAVAFLSRGFMGPLWLALTAAALPLAFRSWRTRGYAVTAGVAVAMALPLALRGRSRWPSVIRRTSTHGGLRSRSATISARWRRRRRSTLVSS